MVNNPRKERWFYLLFCWHYIEHGINESLVCQLDAQLLY